MKGSSFFKEQTGGEKGSVLNTGSGELQLQKAMLGLSSCVSVGSENDSRGRIDTGLTILAS